MMLMLNCFLLRNVRLYTVWVVPSLNMFPPKLWYLDMDRVTPDPSRIPR